MVIDVPYEGKSQSNSCVGEGLLFLNKTVGDGLSEKGNQNHDNIQAMGRFKAERTALNV